VTSSVEPLAMMLFFTRIGVIIATGYFCQGVKLNVKDDGMCLTLWQRIVMGFGLEISSETLPSSFYKMLMHHNFCVLVVGMFGLCSYLPPPWSIFPSSCSLNVLPEIITHTYRCLHKNKQLCIGLLCMTIMVEECNAPVYM
jgi:hypothetical protein